MRPLLLVLIALVLTAGCDPSSNSLITASGTQDVLGRHAVYWESDSGVFLAIWHDGLTRLDHGGGGHTSGHSSGHTSGHGSGHGSAGASSSGRETELKADYFLDQRQVLDFTGHTRDGMSGSVVINGQQFDLGHGGLFLVNLPEQGATVAQLPLPAMDRENMEQELTRLGKTDPRVKEFLGRSAP